jgi:glycosyltransferase involved in cell wall biosynthesis
VVALGVGGACETVVHGETGLLVAEPGAEPFAAAVAEAVNARFDTITIRRHAERFSRERFGDEMSALIMEPAAW